jgi:two-component system response regulator VicR
MGKMVLIVDDEKNIVDILKFNMKEEGYETAVAYDGKAALAEYERRKPDLILLDVMLPLLDGFEVCHRIRETDKTTPIIMLTAREEETDKVLGLDLGADDYITKPFSVRELKARVKANIRRTEILADIAEKTATGKDTLVIDPESFDAFINGRKAELTSREFELISFLAASPGKVYSREELLHEVWQFEWYGDLRAVDVAVRRLREKVEDDSSQPRYIMTKRGAGYYFSNSQGD